VTGHNALHSVDMEAFALVEDRAPPEPAGWDARLALGFGWKAPRTVLTTRRHVGPLRVQKPLYPEGAGVCQVIVVHPPGGIVAGDSLAIDIDAAACAHVQLTTPGAAKWYRSTGRVARSDTTLRVQPGAFVEWMPQETLLFDGARAAIRLAIDLFGDARFIGWDVTCLGRIASGERFASGRFRQSVELVRDDTLLWCERSSLDGGSRALQSGAVLNGAPVFGTLIAAFGPVGDGVLAACRSVACAAGEGAVTRLPQVLVARYRGESAIAARTYFATLWHVLRPAVAGIEAVPPRIWNT
jgi:urease accessory protein